MQLREEQDAVRSRYGDELGPKAMNAMPYALSTVKEILRVLPAIPGIWRYTSPAQHLSVCGACTPVLGIGPNNALDRPRILLMAQQVLYPLACLLESCWSAEVLAGADDVL